VLEGKPPRGKFKIRWDVIFKDLSLFVSLCIARLMVWRVLRRHRKERAHRLKKIKLVQEKTDETLDQEIGNPQC
jgi:hypothetical protein